MYIQMLLLCSCMVLRLKIYSHIEMTYQIVELVVAFYLITRFQNNTSRAQKHSWRHVFAAARVRVQRRLTSAMHTGIMQCRGHLVVIVR